MDTTPRKESADSLAGKAKKRGLILKKSAVPRQKATKPPEKKHIILVVDDEPENLRAVTATLEAEYEILTASDGMEGLEVVENHPLSSRIHLIITDQRMPRMTGVEFLEKAALIRPKIIRIILTGFTDVEAIIDSINKGKVYKFMTKPIDPNDLRITVKRALEAFDLEEAKNEIENRLIRCPQTGLYNKHYLQEYITSEVNNCFEYKLDGSLIFMELDGIAEITLDSGLSALNDVTMGIAYALRQVAEQARFLFKLDGPAFAYYIPFGDAAAAVDQAEKFRHEIEQIEVFLKPVTISAGVVSFSEFFDREREPDIQSDIFNLAQQRLNKAHFSGNQVIHDARDFKSVKPKILIIDSDQFASDVLKQRLENEEFVVIQMGDGISGMESIEKDRPDVILAEVMLPGVDGFLIREKTMVSTDLRQKLFILMSHMKNEDTVQRASALQIEYYFQKPCLPAEIVGVIKTRLNMLDRGYSTDLNA